MLSLLRMAVPNLFISPQASHSTPCPYSLSWGPYLILCWKKLGPLDKNSLISLPSHLTSLRHLPPLSSSPLSSQEVVALSPCQKQTLLHASFFFKSNCILFPHPYSFLPTSLLFTIPNPTLRKQEKQSLCYKHIEPRKTNSHIGHVQKNMYVSICTLKPSLLYQKMGSMFHLESSENCDWPLFYMHPWFHPFHLL